MNTEVEYGDKIKSKCGGRFLLVHWVLQILHGITGHILQQAQEFLELPYVCGENVCGVDPQLQVDSKGKVIESPEMRRRVVGKNIGLWLQEGEDSLPKTVSQYGRKVEEIFVCYEELVAKYGKTKVNEELPLSALGILVKRMYLP